MSVRLSVRMVQLGSYRTDFHEIGYLRIFRKSFDKLKFVRRWWALVGELLCLKTDTRNWHNLKCG